MANNERKMTKKDIFVYKKPSTDRPYNFHDSRQGVPTKEREKTFKEVTETIAGWKKEDERKAAEEKIHADLKDMIQ